MFYFLHNVLKDLRTVMIIQSVIVLLLHVLRPLVCNETITVIQLWTHIQNQSLLFTYIFQTKYKIVKDSQNLSLNSLQNHKSNLIINTLIVLNSIIRNNKW